MSELERIDEAIDEGAECILKALDIAKRRRYQSEDDGERNTLTRMISSLEEALLRVGDARHRVGLQAKFGASVKPVTFPIPDGTYTIKMQ